MIFFLKNKLHEQAQGDQTGAVFPGFDAFFFLIYLAATGDRDNVQLLEDA